MADRLVLAVWGVMALGALAFVGTHGVDVPWEDDWMMVPAITGDQPLGAWLWMQQNEHRLPVTRVIHLALARITGFDSRSGMVFNALALSALALALLRVAARRRGHAAWTDALFPLALLHWGHWWNLLMNMQVFVICAVALQLALVLFVHARGWERRGWIVLLAAASLLLPGHGANGLLLVPPAVGLLAITARVRWCAGDRMLPLTLGAVALATLAGAALYFRGYVTPPYGDAPPRDFARTVAQFLSLGFGLAPRALWQPLAVLMILLLLATAGLIAGALWRGASRRDALGYALCLAGIAALALAVGRGRASDGPAAGLPFRYVTHICALPLVLALTWEGLAPGRLARAVGALLLAVVIALLPYEMWQGHRQAVIRAVLLEDVAADIRAGRTPGEIAARHHLRIFPWSEEHLRLTLGGLERERLGPYRGVTPRPASPSPGDS